jgi:hypothetical protein
LTDGSVAFRADFKLPVAIGSLYANHQVSQSPFATVPQLVLGGQAGRVGFGAGLGFSRLSYSSASLNFGGASGGNYEQLTELSVAPTLTFDAFRSDDGKVALYVLGAPIFGIILQSNQSAASDLGFQFAIGARYALHENFRIGLEAGPLGHFYNLGDNETLGVITLYTALVGSFVFPR